MTGTHDAPGDTKRIHFISDVEDHGAAYKCQRCGHVTGTAVEMYEHRKGLINSCLLARLKAKLRSLRRADGQGDP